MKGLSPWARSAGSCSPTATSSHSPWFKTNAQIAANAVTGANGADGSLTTADLLGAPRAAFVSGNQTVTLGALAVIRSVTISASTAGTVLANASGYFRLTTAAYDAARCTITTGTTIDFSHLIAIDDGSVAGSVPYTPFAGTRGFTVAAGNVTVNLVCELFAGAVSIEDTVLTALFIGQ